MQRVQVVHEYTDYLLVNSESLHRLLKKSYVIYWNAMEVGVSHQHLATLPIHICYQKYFTNLKNKMNLMRYNDKEQQARSKRKKETSFITHQRPENKLTSGLP